MLGFSDNLRGRDPTCLLLLGFQHRPLFSTHNMNEPKKQRRQRAVLSCNDCRRRKLKCDRELPCNRCVKGGIASSCAYEPEIHVAVSENSDERPTKRQQQSPVRQAYSIAEDKPISHHDVPKLFNPSEFVKSDITAEERVKHLERQVALLEQQLLSQRSAIIEAPRIAQTSDEEDYNPPTCLRGFLKGCQYGSFYYGPSSPISIIPYVST
jgi:hypothetical protein